MTNVSRHFWKSPGRQNCLWLETTVMRARVMAKRMVMTAKSLPAETWGFWSAQVRTRHWVVSTWASQVYNSRPTDPPRAHHCDLGTCDEPETAPLPTTPISLRPCRSFSLPLCLHCHITKRNYEGLCKALLFFFFLCCGISPGTFIFIIVDTFSKDHTEKLWGLRCKIITVLPAPGSQRGVSWDSNLVERPKNRLVLEAGMCLDPGLPFKKR